MRTLPDKTSEKGRVFSVADFYEAGKETLSLSIVTGFGFLSQPVKEPIVNRPGLALTGFYGHFAAGRLQLIGRGEMAYLKSLPSDVRRARLLALVEKRAYFFIFTNGQKPLPELLALSQEHRLIVMTSPLKTRVFANLSAFVLERLAAPSTTIYGTMIEVCGLGILFEGDPGLGKSETALGLIKRGSALIADDLTCIRKDVGNNLLYGSASESTEGYMEIRGIGIMHVPSLFGVTALRGEKRLQLIISFRRLQDVRGEIDRIGQTRRMKKILGVDVPNIVIPVSEGRDLVNLVETAAMQQKLLLSGSDPVEALSKRLHLRADLIEHIHSTRGGSSWPKP